MAEIVCASQSARGYYRMDRTFARTGRSSLEFSTSIRPGATAFVSTGANAPGVFGVPEPRVAPVHRVGAPCKTKANVTHNPVTGASLSSSPLSLSSFIPLLSRFPLLLIDHTICAPQALSAASPAAKPR